MAWRQVTTASSTSSRLTIAGRSRRCSASRAIPTPEETETIADAKRADLRGHARRRPRGCRGGRHRRARRRAVRLEHPRAGAGEHGLKLAMPVEKSGQEEFDFQYGDDFPAHIEKFNPDFSKVLVRYNPDDDAGAEQGAGWTRLKRLADWLHENDRKFLFELLVPATDEQLASRRRRQRPLRRRAAAGADAPRDRGRSRTRASRSTSGRSRASTSARRRDAGRAGSDRPGTRGRHVRPARSRRVDREGRAVARGGGPGRGVHRLRDRALDLVGRAQELRSGALDREAAAKQIADNYLHFVRGVRAAGGSLTLAGTVGGLQLATSHRVSRLGRLAPPWR